MPGLIEVMGVKKYYEGGRIKALDDVSMTVGAGEFVAIVGPSGSGKSTLLHLLGALDTPDEGVVAVDGENLAGLPDLAAFRRRKVGLVFQLHNLIPSLTAWENVQMPLMETRMPPGERRRKAMELLAGVDLADRARNRPAQLSGGERQRVAIARALVNNPAILIADEPTGAVDSANAARILDLFLSLGRERGMTLVLVTHDHSVAARADRVVRILDGKIAFPA